MEVMVIDDHSSDCTVSCAVERHDGTGRLTVTSLTRNVGPASARNVGLQLSSAVWICPLDADDFFLPGRIGRLLVCSRGCDFIADLSRSTVRNSDPAG
jgi:succinoglycan biosynthesis protein ExoU